ncbi:hypothetical protein F2P81_005708 [Scophthalmus maximus]|uniref:Uncharacterized protein n=1 Tax=Scophthalmus maximus TaxID=52904 RepID=A0A6A4T3U4_SCOMX|nr:hypothetical protein F2P81_005708 [Scophthalmus maximus]
MQHEGSAAAAAAAAYKEMNQTSVPLLTLEERKRCSVADRPAELGTKCTGERPSSRCPPPPPPPPPPRTR